MNMIASLHNESRRYCINNISFWFNKLSYWGSKARDRYTKTNSYDINEMQQHHNAMFRNDFLNNILTETEKTRPENFKTLDELRKYILDTCENTDVTKTKFLEQYANELKAVMNTAIEDEKQLFKAFIISLNEHNLKDVNPLFYRRVLCEDESNKIKKKLFEADKKYIQGSNKSLYGKSDFIKEKLPAKLIKNILIEHNIERIYEINISRTNYEIDISIFNPYDKSHDETYLFSHDLDWIFHLDHEGYTYIYGEWLIESITTKYPNICEEFNTHLKE